MVVLFSQLDYLPAFEVNTSVSVTNPSIKYNSGEFSVSGKVTADDPNVDAGEVTVKIGSVEKTATVNSDGTWTAFGFSSTAYGMTSTQSISVSYGGVSGSYKASTGTGTLTVNKNTPTITVNDIATVTYNGESYTISGTARASESNSELNSGTITLKTNTGEILSGTTSWSSGTWYVAGISSTLLAPGTYTVTATYSNTDYYNSASSTSKSLTVNKMTPTVIVTGNPNFKYGGWQ